MPNLQIKEPIIIIGCPRSGTSLLFTILSESEHLFSLYRESQDIFDNFYQRKAKALKVYDSDELTDSDLSPDYKDFMLNEFNKFTTNFRPVGYITREHILKNKGLNWAIPMVTQFNLLLKNLFAPKYRMVEKNPRHCFRISFINKLFPDCKFIYLTRDARTNISSLIEGWKRPNDYKRIPNANLPLNIKGDNEKKWRYVLPPGWHNYINKPLEEVCAFQWVSANQSAIDGLKNIENERIFRTTYEELIKNTPETIKGMCNFIEIPYSKKLKMFSERPPVVSTPKNDKPKKDKWLKNKELIEKIYPMIEPMMKVLGYASASDTQTAQSQKLLTH